MKLISLELSGTGLNAWSSGRLTFGERTTQLFGENGCGKTPLVQSIVFAFGYKVEFRDDILEHCDRVVLEVAARGNQFVITRRLGGSFGVIVEQRGGAKAEFINEREYSQFLFSLWGLDDPVVTSVNSEAARLYSAHVLPLFYLDQDHGYADPYYTSSRFIKNQYAEAMRLVFGLGPKNSFDKRRLKLELKERLEYMDRAIRRNEIAVSELIGDLDAPRRPVVDIDRELRTSIASLELLRASGANPAQVDSQLDAEVVSLQQRMRALSSERSELEVRVRGLVQIKHEIEVEADTLSLNEEARRVFSSFDVICGNEGCGLFVRNAASYGKSLLYLKDQVKDLERISQLSQARIEEIGGLLAGLESDLEGARSVREVQAHEPAVAKLVEAVSQLTEKVIDLRRAKQIEVELAQAEFEYVEKLEERAQLQNRLADLDGPTNGTDLDLLKLRSSLQERIKRWLIVLRTSNVGLDVLVDADFNVTFDGQKVSKFKGSTLTRIILAIRTAAFDLSVQPKTLTPRFFILDTPRQQDISRDDLAVYIKNLQDLATENSFQVIYSTTNHRYLLGSGDVEWIPMHPGEDHPMFLGV
ncbi:hypothetical protein [Dyella sp. 20L07]|uniref:hypothetical protein n=1 Tax=Dyella sp. 20L07 TaxID=3384240 RepID=UPI003D2DB36C